MTSLQSSVNSFILERDVCLRMPPLKPMDLRCPGNYPSEGDSPTTGAPLDAGCIIGEDASGWSNPGVRGPVESDGPCQPMKPERFKEIESVFQAALDQSP